MKGMGFVDLEPDMVAGCSYANIWRRSKSFFFDEFWVVSFFLGRNISLARVEVTVTSVTVYIHPISQLILNNWVFALFLFSVRKSHRFRFGVLGFLLSSHLFPAFLLFSQLAYISMRCSQKKTSVRYPQFQNMLQIHAVITFISHPNQSQSQTLKK